MVTDEYIESRWLEERLAVAGIAYPDWPCQWLGTTLCRIFQVFIGLPSDNIFLITRHDSDNLAYI